MADDKNMQSIRLSCEASIAHKAYDSKAKCEFFEENEYGEVDAEAVLAEMVGRTCASIRQSSQDGCFSGDYFLMYLMREMDNVSPIFQKISDHMNGLLHEGDCPSNLHKHFTLVRINEDE